MFSLVESDFVCVCILHYVNVMDMFQGVLSPRGKVPQKVKKMKGIHMLALSEYTITYAQFKGAR